MTGETLAGSTHFLAHGARIADDAPRPFQHTLPFRGQSLETGAALHQHDAKLILELADSGRKRRLRNAAFLRSTTEMFLVGECDEEFQLVDHPASLPNSG